MRPLWTPDSLERALREALTKRTSLKVGPLPGSDAAAVEWSDQRSNAHVRVDNDEVGVRGGVIHELLHVVLDDTLEQFDDLLAEEMVLALEKYLDRRIAKSRRRLVWWRRALAGKLKR